MAQAPSNLGFAQSAQAPVHRLNLRVLPGRQRLQGVRCGADRRSRDLTEDTESTTSSRRESGLGSCSSDSADARKQGLLSSMGLSLSLLSTRLNEMAKTNGKAGPGSTDAGGRRTGGRDAWGGKVDGAAERIRQLAREVNEASNNAQLAAQFANDSKVSELRAQLCFIEDELKKLNKGAAAAGIGANQAATLQNIPVVLQEAIAAAPTVTAPPTVLPEPAPAPVYIPAPMPVGDSSGDMTRTVSGDVKPEGTGHEVVLQGFNWESHKQNWWNEVAGQAEWFASLGFSVVWLPPPTDSVSAEGYLPRDLYDLNSKYGSEAELRRCVQALQAHGLKVLGDAVLNHRCAHKQDRNGVWNQFGGRLNWDETAIVGDDPNFKGRGKRSTGDLFHAAPNIDHTQEFVRRDISDWLCWLRETVGFDGWRLDFVRGFTGEAVGVYMSASTPEFAVGEYWDTLAYNWEGVPEPNQDAHRQRIINWINAAGGRATAFDVTTKGILHGVFERCEYWRLRGADGKPPGVMGWWPSRAVTFLENHDTGSTQGHWRFPHHGLQQGYAYLLTHPGTPCVFYDHLHDKGLENVVQRLITFRRRNGINCRSLLSIIKAERDLYVAMIDDNALMKMGPGDYKPDLSMWERVDHGPLWAVYERK